MRLNIKYREGRVFGSKPLCHAPPCYLSHATPLSQTQTMPSKTPSCSFFPLSDTDNSPEQMSPSSQVAKSYYKCQDIYLVTISATAMILMCACVLSNQNCF